MSNKRPVADAIDIARSLVVGDVTTSPAIPTLVDLARAFAATEFDVPDDRDADGYLFQYGKVTWLPDSTFIVGITRQLEVIDESGEHELYFQVEFEYRYQFDADLETAGKHSEWWFPDGATPFDSWLN
ncbi:hypothetical protein [Amycolatopsis sp. DSM 110486]|uniref:hypothetical protein n=1 Tax=Amycolatopsis sp. DSM 110486 TaxID=2865832 RepID=UPI001C694D03|nr:hypothetical protein [Amycolatopsis sp. DSM 110486]QYN19133.1 hypothetical protein K1T34_41810 [Amycolatopsis sp. DSM 110486]